MFKWIGFIVGGGLILTVGLFIFIMFISTSNKEIELRNQFNAEVKSNEVIFDKVWKVIQQKANVTSQYANDFKGIYTSVMDSRYKNSDNVLFNWIKEQNPTLDASIYKDLSQSIESLRAEFAYVQQKQIDIKREHDNLRKKFPSSLFIGKRPELELKIVTSSKTEAAFATGKDDNVDLFNSKPEKN